MTSQKWGSKGSVKIGSDIDDIDKYDIIATETISNTIKKGDRIEVKKNSIKVSDSFFVVIQALVRSRRWF